MAKIPLPSRKGDPPAPGNTMGNLDVEMDEGLKPLNCKVPKPFKKDYKISAALVDMDMVEVLQESFALWKRAKGL
jgi:hypothetical protein